MKFINQIEPNIDKNEVEHMTRYLKSGGWLTEFKKTREFEQLIADYVGSKYCSVVSNGTVSLAIALWVVGVGPYDEVLVPNFTMIATPNAVKMSGSKPVLVDIDTETLCMDLNKAKEALTPWTKVVIVVSLNGRAPDMVAYQRFASDHGLILIEDSAQALGSFQNGKHLGTFGAIGSFSFSSPKIITTGQGGAIVTDDKVLYEKIKQIKDFGRVQTGVDKYNSLGYNFKFTDIQAVIGIEQMKKLKLRVIRKKEIYTLYAKELEGFAEFITTSIETAPWFVDIYVKRPEQLRDYLKANGVGSRLVFPPINQQIIYKNNIDYPVSQYYCTHGLFLPSSPTLTNEQILYICSFIKNYMKD